MQSAARYKLMTIFESKIEKTKFLPRQNKLEIIMKNF